MKKPLIIVIGIVAALLIVGLIINMANKPSDSNSTNTSDTTQTTTTPDNSSGQESTAPPDDTASAVTTITYSNGSFSPTTVTVKAGDTIEIKNAGGELQFNSDPHPAHTDNPELNVGSVSSGSSKKFTVSSKGTWGYHNHLNQSQTGTIIVQ